MDAYPELSASDDISRSMAGTGPAAAAAAAAEINVEALARDMTRTLDALPEENSYTIARVPAYVRDRKKNLYEPMVIAIGPYYHGNENLRAMEEQKWQFLRTLLHRPDTVANLDALLGKMKALEKKARRSYTESIRLTRKEFVQMMLLDGCFIIEVLLIKRHLVNSWISGHQFIYMDLLLLENQIPFFIIEGLFELVVGGAAAAKSSPTPSLIELIRDMFWEVNCLKMQMQSPPQPPPAEIHHLLHLYYHWVSPVPRIVSVSDHHSTPLERLVPWLFSCFPSMKSEMRGRLCKSKLFIPSATSLSEAGVTIMKKAPPSHMFDITFRNGVLEIPYTLIEDSTKPILTNLVAYEQSTYEQSMPNAPMNITSYSILMDSLINTAKDVTFLQGCEVLHSCLGSEEEVARFFNHLCEYAAISPRDHYFSELSKELNKYRDTKWHSYRAKLVHDYFSNPWAILSLVAALFILALTFSQTFFAIYSYFIPTN